MHLIVAFAAPPGPTARAAIASLAVPALERLLASWSAVQRIDGDDASLSPPHERAWAAALGLQAADGCLPWAARQAAADGIDVAAQAWGLLTPAHWRVGSDGVHLADPAALALSEDESRGLFEALCPLFVSEGYRMAWGAPLRWYAAHESLQGLATASLDRVIGRNLHAWLPRGAAARPVRRLQNEVQMLLHQHPLNQAREAREALPVNSFWLSGCGSLQAGHPSAVRLDEHLREAALGDQATAWAEAWSALDQQAIAPLLVAASQGSAVRLTLCGPAGSLELAPRQRTLWQRLAASWLRPPTDTRRLLETL